MPAVFQWFPDASVQKKVEPRVRLARFGDGYEQRVRDGINTMPQTWGLQFTGDRAEIDAIDDFLTRHGGSDSFLWTTPDGVQGHYICRSWSKQRERGVKVTLQAQFEQVFDLQ